MTDALYLRYRPQTFEDVVGQKHVAETLRNALRQDRIGHAYLFTGPRGTGKTSTARILAKAVNCLAEDVNDRPDNTCPICTAINQGRLMDLIEIDGPDLPPCRSIERFDAIGEAGDDHRSTTNRTKDGSRKWISLLLWQNPSPDFFRTGEVHRTDLSR
jgi:energy-coupling factor transporter ATP-binding protein EcfA2